MTGTTVGGNPEAFAELVREMPGGTLIGDRWRNDPWMVVGIAVDEYEAGSVLGRILDAFPAAGYPLERSTIWVHVPQLAEEMLHWYADADSWRAYTVDDDACAWTGGTLAERLDTLAEAAEPALLYGGLDEVFDLAAELTAAAVEHGIDPDDLLDVVCGLVAGGAPLGGVVDTAAAVCTAPAR